MLRLVSGPEMMAQVCLRRLYCRQGRLLSNPNDNTLDARDFVADGVTQKDLPRIGGQCQGALLGDPRIAKASVLASFSPLTKTLTLNITGTGSLGPFALVLSVTSVTVQILKPN
jgi:hypothetical protein